VVVPEESNGMRRILFRISWFSFLLFSGLLSFSGCSDHERGAKNFTTITGKTMGTTYSIKYASDTVIDLKPRVDSLLADLNHSLSTYEENSLISKVNRSDSWESGEFVTNDSAAVLNVYFVDCFRTAADIHEWSDGAFDPTVGPLVRYWGFGWEKQRPDSIDSVMVDSLRRLTGMQKLKWTIDSDRLKLEKPYSGMFLDFSALAKGYAVDKIAHFLNDSGIKNYMVEIGGEIRVRGSNPEDGDWVLGIQNPVEEAAKDDLYSRIQIRNMSMATSGNYRNYYLMDSVKVFHTLNPQTGYPQVNEIRSATIVHPECMVADAMATAAMVMGKDKTLQLMNETEQAEAFLIYETTPGVLQDTMTSGFGKYLLK
jgi:thiamine biosynthesis lipoprotein